MSKVQDKLKENSKKNVGELKKNTMKNGGQADHERIMNRQTKMMEMFNNSHETEKQFGITSQWFEQPGSDFSSIITPDICGETF